MPSLVRELCGRFLEELDAEAPGLVTGLYLLGSLALGGYREDKSDVDFLAVVSKRPGEVEVAALGRVHARMSESHPKAALDGVYVRAADLSRPAGEVTGQVRANLGSVRTDDDYEPNPVSLHILGRCGLAFRGPDPDDLGLRDDPGALRRWTARNVEEYWAPWVARYARSVKPSALRGAAVERGVLGISRLHYTLATGGLATKEEAGRYAARTFGPGWHEILDETLRLRLGGRGTTYRTPVSRRRDAVDFIRTVIGDAGRLAPRD